MYKLLALAFAFALVIGLSKFAETCRQTRNATTEPIIPQTTIALVKFKDVIYHCQGIIRTNCGHTIHCGDMKLSCITDIEIEYLK